MASKAKSLGWLHRKDSHQAKWGRASCSPARGGDDDGDDGDDDGEEDESRCCRAVWAAAMGSACALCWQSCTSASITAGPLRAGGVVRDGGIECLPL